MAYADRALSRQVTEIAYKKSPISRSGFLHLVDSTGLEPVTPAV